ncbi:MAG: CHAT domain-containing protein [Methylacidiphilales bacterium]|nr:CHAT domain-containing protein [Candidatus Methylacidiphilales bacterium]
MRPSLFVRACALGLLLFGVAILRAADPTVLTAKPLLTPPQIIAQAQEQGRQAEARHDVPALVTALNAEAEGHLLAHEFEQGEKLRLRVLHLEEDYAGRDSLAVSDALLNIGWFYNNMARYEEAQEALDRCRDIRERKLGPDTAPVAEVLNALGSLEENRSNLTLAEAFYQQAIAIREKVLGLENPDTATTRNNLATLYWITGDYVSAQKLFTQALAVREKVLGPKSLAVASTLTNLARLDRSLGDYDDAETYFQRALRIREDRLGPDHPLTITTLSELGLLYVQERDDDRAEPLLVRAVEMREKTYEADHPDVARSQMQLALLYDRKKEYGKAEPLLRQALEIRRQTLGAEHPEYAASVAALAAHEHAQGNLQGALPLYEEAWKIDRDALGDSHPDTVAVAAGLACLKLELGQKNDAAGMIRDVAEAQQKALNGVFTFAPEQQRMDFERTIEGCDLPAALGNADLLAEVVLRTKGIVLDSLLEDEAVARAARDPDMRELIEKQRLLSSQLSREQEESLGPDFSDSPEALAERKKLEADEQELEAKLAERGISSGQTRRALNTDVAEVRDALPEGAALIEYVAYNRYLGRLAYEPAYGAVILTRDGPAQWISLGQAGEINNEVRLYQKYMRKRVREAALSDVLQKLEISLCQPVAAVLPAGIHRLIISPDGNLNFISFATLLDGNGRFFGEDYDLNYVSSGRDLLRSSARTGSGRKRLVVFADPDYGHLPGDGKGAKRVDDDLFPSLSGTEKEAAFLLTEARALGLNVAIYRGIQASKENLMRQDSPYVLHLATHGLYLSEDDVPNFPGIKSTESAAMSRSLLALAGASVTMREWKKGNFPPADESGLFTAQEVANLNLDGTWLVALSACDTGSGEAQAGEGVLGLRRGFAEAGAQNLLLTLWAADDAATADLMEAFYREALQSGDAPAALVKVQRERLQDLRKSAGLSEAVRKAGPFILSY